MTDAEQIRETVFNTIAGLADSPEIKIDADTPLLGDGSIMDSMRLVELCLKLEDMADEMGFVFDWTSEAAMSRSRSMFRSAGALADEFLAQKAKKK